MIIKLVFISSDDDTVYWQREKAYLESEIIHMYTGVS